MQQLGVPCTFKRTQVEHAGGFGRWGIASQRGLLKSGYPPEQERSGAPRDLDQYEHTVPTCSAGGTDLGDWLVRNGLALDWHQYSRSHYSAAERRAKHEGRRLRKGS
jgi:endonuclease YncB( thermonuclease family)